MNGERVIGTSSRYTRSIIFTLIILSVSVTLHLSSFDRSVELCLFDVNLFAEEGVSVLHIPLSRLARQQSPLTHARVWTRESSGHFQIGMKGHTTFSKLMRDRNDSPLEKWIDVDCRFFSGDLHQYLFKVLDFGFFYTTRTNSKRPGPSIKLFVPIWSTGPAVFAVYYLCKRRKMRCTLRSVHILTALVATFIWSTHLHV